MGPPDELVKACLAGQAVLFAGAGLSMAAGLPSPQALAEGMLDEGRLNGRLGSVERSLADLLYRGDLDTFTEGIADALGSAFVVDHLRRTLLVADAPSGVFQRLPALGFSGVITTNFDDLLERSFSIPSSLALTLAETDRLLEALSKNELFLLKLYGVLDRTDSVIISSSRYRDSVVGNEPFGSFLRSLFYSRTLLFAGKSLEGIEEFLSSVPSRSGAPPRHFAAVEDTEPGLDVKASSLQRRFGIQVIPCASGAQGRAIGDFLDALADDVERATRAATVATAKPKVGAAHLARVALENIGPFEHLEVDVDPGWTLLLGDNGVGKSSLLKAVAMALVGEDAAPFASRLVRGSATSASITLTTDRGETYRTEILRSETLARVTSIPVRPLEKEGWLALGFPPLRTVSWERPASYEGGEALGRPSGADVLPLVRGDADPRLDRLKAWLLYLDHNVQSQTTSPVLRNRYRRLWDEFFRVVAEVTPGVNLAPGSINASTRQVFVRTDDGEVPIEAVSQGTQSLMGWIGIFLQRLFEVYGDDEDPRQRYALILMDEIDAHMHPRWQHLLIGTLKGLFPRAQFVASSHSPLVVSGLTRNEILVFSRDSSEAHRVLVEHPPGDLKGWRVDQILTSLAFGLGGARDPETMHDLKRFTELAAQDPPSAPDELSALAAKLRIRLPTEGEQAAARKAFELVQSYAKGQLEAMSAADRKAVTDELRVQIQEGITGSRRPS